MKISGITRRIDELGRIVIPKELRNKLHINKGELLEIYLSEPNVLSLKKFSLINGNDTFVNIFINNLSKKIHADIYVTNMDEIIFSNDNEHIGEKININCLKESKRENQEFKLASSVKLSSTHEIYELNLNGDLSGFIIFDFKDKIKIDKNIIEFSVSYITECFESK